MDFFKASFKGKIIFPTIAILIALVVGLVYCLSARFLAFSDFLINEKFISDTNGLKNHLADSRTKSRIAAVSMAVNPVAVEAIRSRDTRKIIEVFAPACELYQIDYYTVTDPEGIVLARTYEPERFGDSVLNQQNVRDALDGQTSSYFESGTLIQVSARAGAPVYDTDGAMIGVISAGIRFDTDDAVDRLKALFNSEISVFREDTRIATTFFMDGRRAVGATMDPVVAQAVSGGIEYSTDIVVFEGKFRAFFMPLQNAKNEAFATIFLGIPQTELQKEASRFIHDGIFFGLAGLLVSALVLSLIISSISQPLTHLTNDMGHVADGRLAVNVRTDGADEVGRLGRSLRKVVDIIQKLLQDINAMITEHERGNTAHRLNSSEFRGEYGVLAENILKLSFIGLMDPLTGLPNRRNFDGRTDLEWKRAIREPRPISILMIDVDHFKTYNDSYGHQQGDVALRTVAGVLERLCKRSTDLAARWGGEEFIVLLPNTDRSDSMVVAEHIRAEIEGATIPCADARAAKVTVSIGAYTLIPVSGISVASLIAGADGALYKAKKAGRNRIVFGEGGVPEQGHAKT